MPGAQKISQQNPNEPVKACREQPLLIRDTFKALHKIG